jgi:hypothetical protein
VQFTAEEGAYNKMFSNIMKNATKFKEKISQEIGDRMVRIRLHWATTTAF